MRTIAEHVAEMHALLGGVEDVIDIAEEDLDHYSGFLKGRSADVEEQTSLALKQGSLSDAKKFVEMWRQLVRDVL